MLFPDCILLRGRYIIGMSVSCELLVRDQRKVSRPQGSVVKSQKEPNLVDGLVFGPSKTVLEDASQFCSTLLSSG